MPDSAYDLLTDEVAPFRVGTRTMSAAMLAWFLTTVWRLEPEDLAEAICDGGGDKGIDALVVDDDLAEITIFQGKWRETAVKTQGDNDLRSLVGAADYFASAAAVDGLLAAKPNAELRNLLVRQEVHRKIEDGSHLVRLVFVTNAHLDAAGADFVAARKTAEPELDVWDRDRLAYVADRARRAELRPETVRLTAVTTPTTVSLTAEEQLSVAVVPAQQLVDALPGISDYTLFSRNVRLFAGRTRINKDLRETVRKADEHELFPAYHNGLTILTERLAVEGSVLTLDRVGVVNGCQSLVTLFENSKVLTDKLLVLVKVVEVHDDSSVADKITFRSNNQNPVTMRDQRSSDVVMRDLQKSVRAQYGSTFALRTRVGENIAADRILDNTEAAQLIMAAYLREPWAAVRKVRLFDQDYRRIFNRSITPSKLYLVDLIDSVSSTERARLRDDLRSSFASIRFTLVHLITQVLRETELGTDFIETPENWLPDLEGEVRAALTSIAEEVVDSVNFYVGEQEQERGSEFDPKVVFKSQSGVTGLEYDVLRQSRRQAKRDATILFNIPSQTTARDSD
ncbi:AIPR family protein [Asanoa siamensis]|uniref:Abortive phage infection protein C-terminal domain-containing protein n=1 Tax=Asanoa siamensis TaxID=926357 RepID=A0ABQ4CY26_9ACTN|nr:AIPR family protein [Asanoa siamensis]GIF76198.1 hypothetical protein Asi02nite_57160 [Asanoa siamensis]